MILIQNFFDLITLYTGFKTLFIYLLISIKKSSSIIFVLKKTFCKLSKNFLEKISNIIYDLKYFSRTWQFIYLSIFFLITSNYLIFSAFIIAQIFSFSTFYFFFFFFFSQISSSQRFNKYNNTLFVYIYYDFIVNCNNKLNWIEQELQVKSQQNQKNHL